MAFDPLHRWLGIAPHEQPPDHYRLLGLARFEDDPDVIDSAANRQMAYVQGFAAGPHGPESQRLLNQLAAARLCLLDPKRRASYDTDLRAANDPARPATPPPPTPARAPSKLMVFGAPSPPPATISTRRDTPSIPPSSPPPPPPPPARRHPPLPPRVQVAEDQDRPAAPRSRRAVISILTLALFLSVLGAIAWLRPPAPSPTDVAATAPPAPAPGPPDDDEPDDRAAVEPSPEKTERWEGLTPPDDEDRTRDKAPGTARVAFGESYYQFIPESLSWPEAEARCRELGGRLACLETTEKIAFAGSLLDQDDNTAWVGGFRTFSSGWLWLNRNFLDYGRVRGFNPGLNYIALERPGGLTCRTRGGLDSEKPGRAVRGFLCEWESPTGGTTYPPFYLAESEPVGEIARLIGHSDYVTCVDFAPDGRRVATGSNDGTVRLWDVRTGRQVWTTRKLDRMLLAVAFRADGLTVDACDRQTFHSINAESGEIRRSEMITPIEAAVFSPDRRMLAARKKDGTLVLFRLPGLTVASYAGLIQTGGTAFAFGPRNESIYLGQTRLSRFDLNTSRSRDLQIAQASNLETLALTRDGGTLVSGSGRRWDGTRDQQGDRAIRLWDADSGRNLATFIDSGGWIWCLALTPDDRGLLVGGSGKPDDWYGHLSTADTTIRYYDLETRSRVRNFEGHRAAVLALAVAPDGNSFASASADGTARLWRLPSD